MRSILSMISLTERSDIVHRVTTFIIQYGQLMIALALLIALFFFYDTFIQSEMAKLLETRGFTPPTVVR